MAFRALQLCVVFAIGVWTGVRSETGAIRAVGGGGGGGGGAAAAAAGAAGGGSGLGTAAPGGNISLSLLVQDPRDVTVARGQPATLRCPIGANSTGGPFTTTWLHDGRVVAPNRTHFTHDKQILADGSLYIRNVGGKRVSSAEGSYTCLVQNQHGVIRTNAAKLRIAKMAKDFITQPIDTVVEQGQPCRLFCQIKSNPPAVIVWERDRTALPQSTRYVPLPSGDLLITSTQKSDAGSYRCKALNEVSQKHRYSNEALLNILPPLTTIRSPQIIVLSHELNYTAHIGTDLPLICICIGFPKPQIRWTNNNNNNNNSNNASTIVGNSSVMWLRNISVNNAGVYTCTASNSAGLTKQSFNVNVVQSPYFVVKPVSQWFPLAMTVRLECKADGVPPPTIHWLKDGEPLSLGGRIKMISPYRWLLSHTFTTDKGLYQCVAENKYGRVWSAAELNANSSKSKLVPPPPINVRCSSYNNSSVCLQWDVPPGVESYRAFTVHSFNADLGEEYLTNKTYHLAQHLKPHTNYTFYIRLYEARSVSDQSKNITCETVLKGSRNLKIKPLSNSTLRVDWTSLSSDIPCGGMVEYKLQWKRFRHASINVRLVNENFYIITDLIPSQKYEIRVQTPNNEEEELPWMEFIMPNNSAKGNDKTNEETTKTVKAPINLEAEPLSPFNINLTWKDSRKKEDIPEGGYYMICYREIKSQRICENDQFAKSSTTSVEINNLTPYTVYEFKVRAHNLDGSYGSFSDPIECKTLEYVPNPIKNLISRVNNGSVCIRWQRPNVMNGQLQHYVISYSFRNQSLDQWPAIVLPASQVMDKSCWRSSSDTVSLPLQLEAGRRYKVVVRAETKGGISAPSNEIEVKTLSWLPANVDRPLDDFDDVYRNQKLGIIVGVCISILCIIACVSCMIFRRRCLKARALERARRFAPRSTNGQNLPTLQASTSLRAACPPLSADRPCGAEAHELQYLVAAERDVGHIPPLSQSHLDTKGGVSYPNGQINGLKHVSNGHIPNGHVHITENPQFDEFDCNGHTNLESHQLLMDQSSSQLEDNSILLLTKDDSLNSTQLTSMDESLRSTSRTPVLGPNG